MYEFNTAMYLGDEERPLRVTYEVVFGDILLEKIEMAIDVNETYTRLGVYCKRELAWQDITTVVSDRQALALTREIKEAALKARAEDYDDGRMQDWEERQRNVPA